jgi:MOSC domain-containing protein YiiM
MGKIIEIGICKEKGGKIIKLNEADLIKGEGILNDRKYKKENNKKKQITLIEIENINHYNKVSSTKFPARYFRRNIVTKDINLNNLLNKEFYIGNVKFFAHDLCRPCKYLEKLLNTDNLMKVLFTKGGLRCEILTNGKIFVGDTLKF